MIPLFKSHYSIGKSILTLAPATVGARNGSASAQNDTRQELDQGPASIFDIAQKHQLQRIILVEDSLIGFLEAKKMADELGVQLIFGLRLDICDSMSAKITRTSEECVHKLIIFARTDKGCSLLNKIYSLASTRGGGKIDFKSLRPLYNDKDLKICIPFYDSFLFHNLFSYKNPALLDSSFFTPTFFIEDNKLPFDVPLAPAVEDYAQSGGFATEKVKSIYYENRADFEAYQTYKCICGRGFSAKSKTLDMPNLDHCGSPEFCFESYLEYESA